MKRPTLSVLLADDHEIVLQGVKRIVDQIPLVGPVAISLWGEDAVQQVETRTFDLCLMEIEMTRCDGFELIERIQSVSSATRIIVYTMHEEPWTIHKLTQCGVHGIVSKSSRAEELSRALDCVLAGGCYLDDRLQKLCRVGGGNFQPQ